MTLQVQKINYDLTESDRLCGGKVCMHACMPAFVTVWG